MDTILQYACISKTKKMIYPNYNMIDNMNPDNFCGLVESVRNFEVFLPGVGVILLGGYESRQMMWKIPGYLRS
jgi:hypothetical protein